MLNHKYCPKRKKRLWAYAEDQLFIVAGMKFKVPAGYWFDGATVPRPFHWLFSPTGIAFEAAALHDWLYDTQGAGYALTRKDVDWLFYRHMLQDKTPRLQAWIMWLAVRTPAGKAYWDKDSFPEYLKANNLATKEVISL
jgi:hypothetical protein